MPVSNVLRASDSAIGAPTPATRNGWTRRPGSSSNRICARGSSHTTLAEVAPPTAVVCVGATPTSISGNNHGNTNWCAIRAPNSTAFSSAGWAGASSIYPSADCELKIRGPNQPPSSVGSGAGSAIAGEPAAATANATNDTRNIGASIAALTRRLHACAPPMTQCDHVRILVVEDEASLREGISDLLRGDG